MASIFAMTGLLNGPTGELLLNSTNIKNAFERGQTNASG